MASTGTKIERLGITREEGFLYYLKGTDVWRSPMKRPGAAGTGKAQRVAEGDFTREAGYLYYLDGDGDIARSARKAGGARKRKA